MAIDRTLEEQKISIEQETQEEVEADAFAAAARVSEEKISQYDASREDEAAAADRECVSYECLKNGGEYAFYDIFNMYFHNSTFS